MKQNDIFCIIMAGGAGTRFWPLSRDKRPKQFLDILGIGKTFVQQTFERFTTFIPKENILFVIGEAHRDILKEQLPEVPNENILVEPIRRNTAPCIAYATYKLYSKHPNATVIVSPSDHLILDEPAFIENIKKCVDTAQKKNNIVTIGIEPTRPETGYGYIQINKKGNNSSEVYPVKTFTEKPNLEMANIFCESGEFFWNSGIFIWTLETIKSALETYLPEVAELLVAGPNIYYTPKEPEFIAKAYSKCPSISIDFGVLEKARNVDVVCAKFRWSDLGTWNSLYRYKDKDEHNNVVEAEHNYIEQVSNSFIKTNQKKLAVIKGLDNYLVIDTDDVLVVCPKQCDEDIKGLVYKALLKNREYL